jgi:hypothetical protein
MDAENVNEIEEKIVELKTRWPANSVPLSMRRGLENLQEELKKVEEKELLGEPKIFFRRRHLLE